MRVLRWPGRGVRGRKRFHYLPTYVPASRQLSRLWIDFTNYLAICRAWVQFFLQWDAWVGNLEGMGYWTLQEKCPWSYWKMGKGGKRDLYGIGKVKRGRPPSCWCGLLRKGWIGSISYWPMEILLTRSYPSSLVVFSMYVISFQSPNSVHASMLCMLYWYSFRCLQLQPDDSSFSISRAIAWFRYINAFLMANQSSFTFFYIR